MKKKILGTLSIALMASFLACATPKQPSADTIQQTINYASGISYGACSLLPAKQKLDAIPILVKLQSLAKTNITAFVAQMEAVLPGNTGALGQIWYGVSTALKVIGVAAAYQPALVASVDSCLLGVGYVPPSGL